MKYRKELYLSLVKELMGPRNGAEEVMEQDPRDEYLVGILEPKDYVRGGIEDYSITDIKEEIPSDKGSVKGVFEDDDDDSNDLGNFDYIATLDPRALPKSMGISFIVEGSVAPSISVCATWARYISETGGWKRYPKRHMLLNYNASSDFKDEIDNGIMMVIRSAEIGANRRHISVFLINTTKGFEKGLKTEHLIFQPQIRVSLNSGLSIKSLIENSIEGEDDKRLAMLYRDLPTLAKGHLCSAVWKEVDPERPFENDESKDLIPEDIKNLESDKKVMFVNPDVRSEYLPIYSVVQSVVEVDNIDGMTKDDLNSSILSEKWRPAEVSNILRKLTSAYEKWIEHQKKSAESLNSSYKKIALNNMAMCESSLLRMKDGIDILEKDEDAMLAFSFMNKAMNKQSTWVRDSSLIWRPFQMAFILQCIRGIVDESHRDVCDLLWFPTGGGKTEAYLGLMIFATAYFRIKHKMWDNFGFSSEGTSVLSRYTLRLLTIQQFRRTLNAITACELLRTTGWLPVGYRGNSTPFGGRRFSVGLWVGGGVTPNCLTSRKGFDTEKKIEIVYLGALSKLTYARERKTPFVRFEGEEGEPAQVLECPACKSILAIPKNESDMTSSSPRKEHIIYWIVSSTKKPVVNISQISSTRYKAKEAGIYNLRKNYYVLKIRFEASSRLTDVSINEWCSLIMSSIGARLECTAGSRPGYFIRRINDTHRTAVDFEIHCPNPECELNKHEWIETNLEDSENLTPISEPFEIMKGHSKGIPIPAFTVDSQIYQRCPSIILATVDKFARMPFEPRCSSIFGNVDSYDNNFGYYRNDIYPECDERQLRLLHRKQAKPFAPPQLIIQDELHLIEGPLGSLVGLYEIAIDAMSTRNLNNKTIRPKYIASTATVRRADDQVKSIYDRALSQFPSQGISIMNNFFSKTIEEHPLDEKSPGRLYMGVCAPGKGPQSPIRNIWANLLQTVEILRRNNGGVIDQDLDNFWTLVGYFNAIRELAGVSSLYGQDIREHIKKYGITNARSLEPFPVELSSRRDSMELPAILELLSKPGEVDAVLATSMFGTGVDVDRLGLMVVHGQPKTTASYIQSTGRVGRKRGGLVVTFLRSTRPRDLDHYEFFIGYHRAFHRQVEPITVAPFSSRAVEKALGPVVVSILRDSSFIGKTAIDSDWAVEFRNPSRATRSGARKMFSSKDSKEVKEISEFIVQRSQNQPKSRKKDKIIIEESFKSDIDRWSNISRTEADLLYNEPTFNRQPLFSVVLGDEQHKKFNKKQVFENVPQSLREVEQTSRFEG